MLSRQQSRLHAMDARNINCSLALPHRVLQRSLLSRPACLLKSKVPRRFTTSKGSHGSTVHHSSVYFIFRVWYLRHLRLLYWLASGETSRPGLLLWQIRTEARRDTCIWRHLVVTICVAFRVVHSAFNRSFRSWKTLLWRISLIYYLKLWFLWFSEVNITLLLVYFIPYITSYSTPFYSCPFGVQLWVWVGK